MTKRLLGLVFTLAAASAVGIARDAGKWKGPDEDGTKPALIKIAGEGTMDSRAYQFLTELSDEVGGRVTGTPQGQKAIDWGVEKMKLIGLENVHAEAWSMWKGWTRGKSSAEVVEPLKRELSVDAMGWTGSTPEGGSEGELTTANLFNLDDEIAHAAKFRGKIVMMVQRGYPKQSFWLIFAQYGGFLRALEKEGALAVIGGEGGFESEGMHLTHTGILGFSQDFTIPVVSITREDQGQLNRFLSAGKKVRVRINVQNTFSTGPVESANVVGEIRGREHPEEFVVVGAHLDSWDLGEGSTDNGTGTASVLAAADAILKSGLKPRRSIRFVLFTGEEQGLLGSFEYVKQHQSEMKNHIGDIVLDLGQGPIREFQLGGRSDLVAAFEPFAKSLRNIREINVSDKVEFGTDTGAFIMAGLPGINLDQDSPEYKYTHHSAGDALESVKPDILAQNSTIMGLTAYWMADRPERLASPWPAEKTARMLREKGEYEMLKAFNLWPFGELGAEGNADDK
jgi:carboxypeptidase Q